MKTYRVIPCVLGIAIAAEGLASGAEDLCLSSPPKLFACGPTVAVLPHTHTDYPTPPLTGFVAIAVATSTASTSIGGRV